MYAKCGDLEQAKFVYFNYFFNIPLNSIDTAHIFKQFKQCQFKPNDPSVVDVWTEMMQAYGMFKQTEEALKLFQEMESIGIIPTE